VTDEESFRNAEYWIKKIRKHGDSHVEILLIGNKMDLRNDIAVNSQEAKTFA
jgi:GTPase SAR1 family protein